MDMIMMTAIVVAAAGAMVLLSVRPREERLPVRVRVEKRRKF
ncbi:hypothetical protein [Celeribacter litoreus]|nr:hypothetical protein [Celeribacter litoreus]